MNFEKTLRVENIGKNKERLLFLEKEGKVVFHGSPNAIDVLEPRQASGQNEESGEYENDGSPAVFATQFADVAIFSALIEKKDKTLENSFGIDDENNLHFLASKKLIEQAKNIVGKVYVLDKQKFDNFRGLDCRSEEPVVPIEVIDVTVDDLPQNIEIVE